MASDLGTRVKRARQLLGLKQWQLAERLGVSVRAVVSWERGEKVPQNLYALEAALAPHFTVNGTAPPPPADPRERELYDLALVDAGPEGAWAVVEEFRRRKRSRIA